MSLYYDAASILTASKQHGSLKSRIYAKDSDLKSKPTLVYALISETAKYDTFLKEVIDNAGILAHETKLTPLLALLLTHDHFFSKGGIATAASHPLRQSIEKHKARLQSEFTKARLRRRIPTAEKLKAAVLKEKGISGRTQPRWARVNTLKNSYESIVQKHFSSWKIVQTVEEMIVAGKDERVLYVDPNVLGLMGFSPELDLTKHPAYLNGEIILQDKASCFPAYLLVGTDAQNLEFAGGIDGCAAPGNKTTHLADLIKDRGAPLFACERDATRSKTLQMMVDKAGASKVVTVLQNQDFLALDPMDERFQNVTHLLLDPSCSGSGILGREDIPELALPKDLRKSTANHQQSKSTAVNDKKRKRGNDSKPLAHELDNQDKDTDPTTNGTTLEEIPTEATKLRLTKLSNLQSRIVEHGFAFPAAKRLTYSTCSIHTEENEEVVARVLASEIGKARGWTVLKRQDQVAGLRDWKHRGIEGDHGLSSEQREACIRCTPDDGEGTMGFFVCGFVRDDGGREKKQWDSAARKEVVVDGQEDDDEWEGFSDS